MKLAYRTLFAVALLALPLSALHAADPDPYDQSGIPLEVEPTDAKLAKIVLVAGKGSHFPGEHEHFAGCVVLMNLLKQTPDVFPVLVRDGWPKNEKVFQGAKTIVFFLDGGGQQPYLTPERMAVIQKAVDAGTGIVHLHTAIDYPKAQGEQAMKWLGGYWEKSTGCRSHWVAQLKDFPEHPITRGVKPFAIDDGWLFNNRFVPDRKGVTPIVTNVPPEKNRTTADAKQYPGRAEVMGWAYERPDSGRAYVFVGCHLHSSWGDENLRRLTVNAILWTAKLEVPKDGAPVALKKEDLLIHLDRKEPAKPKK